MKNRLATYLLAVPLIAIGLNPAVPARLHAMEAEEIVCIQCHSTLEGRYGEPVKQWRGSIHAVSGIACNSCHGGDPKDASMAMSPARGFLGVPKKVDIPAFCGRCHIGVMNDYLASPHGRALAKGGPNCVTCHDNHKVVKASLDLINEASCSRCHSYERARMIREAMQQTEIRVTGLDRNIHVYKNQGVETDPLEKHLFLLRNRFHSMSHTIDVAKVRDEAARINSELSVMEKALQKIDDERNKRKIIGLFLISGALLAALFLRLLKRTYDSKSDY